MSRINEIYKTDQTVLCHYSTLNVLCYNLDIYGFNEIDGYIWYVKIYSLGEQMASLVYFGLHGRVQTRGFAEHPLVPQMFHEYNNVLMSFNSQGGNNKENKFLIRWSDIWAASWQNQQNGMCAQRRLRSAWASFSYPLSVQRRLWSDGADGQADLSLRWAHMSFCWFCHEAAHLNVIRSWLNLFMNINGLRNSCRRLENLSAVGLLSFQNCQK